MYSEVFSGSHSACWTKKPWLDTGYVPTKYGIVEVYIYSDLGGQGRYHANTWYEEVGRISGGYLLQLSEFHNVVPLVKAVCYRQNPTTDMLERYEVELAEQGVYGGRGLVHIFDTLLERKPARNRYAIDRTYASTDLRPVPAGRFQPFYVQDDIRIDEFVDQYTDEGFVLGHGFYQLSKRVIVQRYKEIILQDVDSGDFFAGGAVRQMIGLKPQLPRGQGTNEKLSPVTLSQYRIFIQSTAPNRKLLGDTMFLYEIEAIQFQT